MASSLGQKLIDVPMYIYACSINYTNTGMQANAEKKCLCVCAYTNTLYDIDENDFPAYN